MDLAFFDTETTGLSPFTHEILEAWVLRVDRHTLDLIEEGGGKVAPTRFHTATPRALEINHFNRDVWDRLARPWSDVWDDIWPLLEGANIVGSNPRFDLGFLWCQNKRHGISHDLRHGPVIDTRDLAKKLKRSGAVDSCSLDTLCRHFEITGHLAHSASGDCRRALEVYRRLTR